MNPNTNINFEKAADDEFPPGEEWRGKLREALDLLGQLDYGKWVKIYPIEPETVARIRSAAHSTVNEWNTSQWPSEEDESMRTQLITKYDSSTKIFWMTTQAVKKEEKDEDEQST